jgi:hypothetical protein
MSSYLLRDSNLSWIYAAASSYVLGPENKNTNSIETFAQHIIS